MKVQVWTSHCLPYAGHIEQGEQDGWLKRVGGGVQVTAPKPTRDQLLLALQAASKPLRRHDVIQVVEELVPVEAFWAAVAGGPDQVGGTNQLALLPPLLASPLSRSGPNGIAAGAHPEGPGA